MLRSGDQIGPYTLVNKLGRGAFGTVWLSERRTTITTTTAALKIPLDDDIDLETIKHEANLWVRASGHPNVLPIIEANIYDDQVVIASEYAPDGSLEAWLKQNGGKSPSFDAAVGIMSGILAGLEHLHARSIIHRDLKPANILFQGTTPRLADFGISRVLKSTSQISIVAGTPSYMAPEAFDGKRNEQTDIWSAGVIFYQLLAGCLPFPQSDITSLVGAILSRPPDSLPTSIPSSLREIVARALAKDPIQRYKSAAEMGANVRSLNATSLNVPQKTEPARTNPASLARTTPLEPLPARPEKQRNTLPFVWIVAALLGALIIGAAAMSWLKTESKNTASANPSSNPTNTSSTGSSSSPSALTGATYEEGDPAELAVAKPNPLQLIVKIASDNKISLNQDAMGSLDDTTALTNRLADLFRQRKEQSAFRPGTTEVETTVWILRPNSLAEPKLQTFVQALKATGANPIKVIDEQKYLIATHQSEPNSDNGPVDYTKIFSPREVDQKARILSKPEPQYTEEARRNQVSGTVVLRVVFSRDGQVTNITVANGLPNGLTEKAIAAARQIKFVPAEKDGQPVSQRIQVEYNFNLY